MITDERRNAMKVVDSLLDNINELVKSHNLILYFDNEEFPKELDLADISVDYKPKKKNLNMKEFWCDFSASIKVEAEDKKQVQEKFWDFISSNSNLEYIYLEKTEEIKD